MRASPSLLVGGRLTKKPTALVSARAQRACCIGWVRIWDFDKPAWSKTTKRHLHNNPHRFPRPIQPACHGVCQPLSVMYRPHRGRTTTPHTRTKRGISNTCTHTHTLPMFIHISISYSSLTLYYLFALFPRMHATTTDQRKRAKNGNAILNSPPSNLR